MKCLGPIFFLFFTCFTSAGQESNVFFAKSEMIQLASPQIKCDSELFRGSSTIGLEFDCPGAGINYSVNDGEWQKYTAPIDVQESCSIKAKAVHPDFKESELVGCSLFKAGFDASDSEVLISPKPDAKYTGRGEASLVDLKVGGVDFRKGWLGFQADTVCVDLILKREEEVSGIAFHVFRNHAAWIFLPERIEIYSEGKMLVAVDLEEIDFMENLKSHFVSIEFPIVLSSDFSIKVINQSSIPDWHIGAGSKPWFFIDEILLN